MKYFTPQLIARYRSEDDEISDAAFGEWDIASEVYEACLEEIKRFLPGTVRNVIDTIRTHDAKVINFGCSDMGSSMFIELIPEGSNEKVVFVYNTTRLNGQIHIFHHHMPETFELNDKLCVLCDEFGLGKDGFFTHNILLIDGTEIEIYFKSMTVSE